MDASKQLVTIFGGSGFVGTQLVQLLAKKGHRILVAVRRPDLAGHVRPFGAVGQIVPIQANVRSPESVARAVRNADIVINLVGIGFERGNQNFEAVHIEGARNVAQAAAAAGAKHLVHMSILGADPASPSEIARSRAEGEAEVFAAFPEAVVMRPSLIFGPGDGFFNLMGSLSRVAPIMPVICARTRFQPVYVKDVAAAFVTAAEGQARSGEVYELGGPEIETHRELLRRILREAGRGNVLWPVGPRLGRLLALPMSLLPRPLLTGEQVKMLQVDNIVSEAAIREERTLEALGITPTPMGAILPSYLWRFRKHGQFDRQTA
jgi:NADH dehydrogenase